MRQLVLLQFGQMIANQLGRQPISFAAHFELHQQTFAHVARATAHRLEPHDNRARSFDDFFRPTTLHRDLFVGRVQAAVRIEISDDDFGRVVDLTLGGIHVSCHSRCSASDGALVRNCSKVGASSLYSNS